MNKLLIDVAKLSAYAFAGLVAGGLCDRNVTADVRGEQNGQIVIVVWRSGSVCHYNWYVNKVTKEILSSGPVGTRPISRAAVEMLLDQNSNNERLAELIWGDDDLKQTSSAA